MASACRLRAAEPFRSPSSWQVYNNSMLLPHNYSIAMRDLEKSSPRTGNMMTRIRNVSRSGDVTATCQREAERLYRPPLYPQSINAIRPQIPIAFHQITQPCQSISSACPTSYYRQYWEQQPFTMLETSNSTPTVLIPPQMARANAYFVVI